MDFSEASRTGLAALDVTVEERLADRTGALGPLVMARLHEGL